MVPFKALTCICLALVFILTAGCDDGPPPEKPSAQPAITQQPPDTFNLPAFSGQAAYQHIEQQVSFGPRNPNSIGHQKALQFFLEELGKYADEVTRQDFTHTGYDGEVLNLANVIASFNKAATRRILLCAHWDTRPRADMDDTRTDEPIIGANDGGSGVGVLLELARILKEHPPEVGIDIVLFDGEDYGHQEIDDLQRYFLGSRHFVDNLPPGYKPSFGVLLDLVGDVDAQFYKEGYSMQYARGVVETLWKAARELGLPHFINRIGPPISDDHKILNEGGIPTIDIIDSDLVGNHSPNPRRSYWHTHRDTLDNISSETLGAVGKLLVHMIYKLAPAAASGA